MEGKSLFRMRLACSLALAICMGSLFAADIDSPGRRYAVLIGVNDYADSSIVKLTTPRNDARDLARDLESSGWDKVFVLTDDLDYRNQDFPSRTNIENRIHLLADLVKPDDTVFLFFSGHGVNDGAESSLLPVDAALSRLSETSIRISSLVSVFNEKGIRKVILAVDACREQVALTKGISVVGVTAGAAKNAAALTLYATKAGWYSYEDSGGKNSVFTRCMLDGLRGAADGSVSGTGDGVVTFSELAAWLPDATGAYALDKGIRQQAVAFNGSGDQSALNVAAARVSATPRAYAKSDRAVASSTGDEIAPIVDSIKTRVTAIVADSLKRVDESLAAKTAASSETLTRSASGPDPAAAVPQESAPAQDSPAEDSSPRGAAILQLSFVGPLQCIPASYDIYGFALGLMSTNNHAVYGFQVAPVTVAGDVRGAQTGVVCVAESVGILQSGGAFGYAKKVYGVQVSPVNVAGDVYGLQIGVVNVAHSVHGAQLGFANVMQTPGMLGHFMFGINIGW